MSRYHICPSEKERTETEWGELVHLLTGAEMGAKSGFSLSSVTYRGPHYSGTHDDFEAIVILEGEGVARIEEEEIPFTPDSVLAIPPGTEHEIASVRRGPVRALLVHFE